MNRCIIPTANCRRADVLRAAITGHSAGVLPFQPIGPIDTDDELEFGPAGMASARFLARWQRAAHRSGELPGRATLSSLDIITVDDHHQGYVACGAPEDVDELAALALAMIELAGHGIIDHYRTADRTAAAIVVECRKGGAL